MTMLKTELTVLVMHKIRLTMHFQLVVAMPCLQDRHCHYQSERSD